MLNALTMRFQLIVNLSFPGSFLLLIYMVSI